MRCRRDIYSPKVVEVVVSPFLGPRRLVVGESETLPCSPESWLGRKRDRVERVPVPGSFLHFATSAAGAALQGACDKHLATQPVEEAEMLALPVLLRDGDTQVQI